MVSLAKKIRVRVFDEAGRTLGDLDADELAEYITKLPNVTEIARKSGSVELPLRFASQIMLLNTLQELPIDSTGVKLNCGYHVIHRELYEQAKAAYFGAQLDPPTAEDAVVHIELYDRTSDDVIEFLDFVGEGGYKEKMLPLRELVDRDGHSCRARFNVKQASATSGAKQTWCSAWIVVIYDYMP